MIGKIVRAFIRAGWNPPPPSSKAMLSLIEDIQDVSPLATLKLSPGELRALGEAAEGLTREEAARRHSVSPYTIQEQRKTVLRKLGARSMPQAIAIAFRSGLLE